jgi:hypothetical protein
MKLSKKFIGVTVIVSTLAISQPQEAKAFGPASHFVLIQKVGNDLPQQSVIGQAIREYPSIAAWGATGPDLGYLQPAELGGYAPWADRYHYFKVGSFAKEQLQEALNSGDTRKIAFAAGWVSHISGDLACHGIYVNPESGVYLDNISGRDLHKKLENMAEPYVWSILGGLPISDFKNEILGDRFSEVNSIPFQLMNSASNEIYGQCPSVDEEKQWSNILLAGLKTGVGYSYANYDEANSFLNESGRKERLTKAFLTAEDQCTKLLKFAEGGNYSHFSDRWNLDVGASESPISSLAAIVRTGTKSLSGTDDDIYFGIELKTGDKKEWLLDKSFYNDFENGDKDEYYLYINDVGFSPSLVKSVWLRKVGSSFAGNWYLESLDVDVNGENALAVQPSQWVKGNDTVDFDADWSSITNTSDPIF